MQQLKACDNPNRRLQVPEVDQHHSEMAEGSEAAQESKQVNVTSCPFSCPL